MKRSSIALLTGASLLASTSAFAQSTAPVDPAAPAAEAANSETNVTSDIVVTAQRRSEKLQDVPITISNVSADSLRKSGAQSLSDITKVVPGIRFDTRAGLMQPTIRGVGTPINLAGAGTNVGIYVDGFYNPAPLASDFQLLNVDSIQVLKGPQGTLFGRNTSGGAIQVNTSQPSTTTKGSAQASYGSYNTAKLQGYFTTGLTDTIAFDVGALYSRGDGYVTNGAPKDPVFANKPGDKVGRYENWSVRASIKADITDNLSVTLRYIHDNRDDPTPVLFQPYLLNGRPLASSAYAANAIPVTQPRHIAADEELSIHGHTNNYQVAAKLDLNFATLSSYTMYRKDAAIQHYSLDYGIAKTTALIYPDDNKTFSQEFILSSKAGSRLQWTVGAFFYDNKEVYPGVKVSAGVVPATGLSRPFTQTAASGVRSVSIAAFGDATYEVVDNLFLTAGVRYTHDKQKDAFFVTSGFANPPLVTVPVPDLNNSKVTPRAVIRYQMNPASSVYASFSQGFKSAILNVGGGTLVGINIKPEKIDAYEVGYKYGTRDLSFNISGYYYNYRDQQITANQDVGNPPVPQSVLTNAASSHIYGIDADLRYQLADRFQVNLGASYNHARFANFRNAPYYFENPTTHNFVVQTRDASGGHMARSPDFSGTAAATYTFDVMNGRLDLSGNVSYSSRFFFDTVEEFSQKAYTTVGLRAEWTDPSEHYSIGVAANNVTDKDYLTVASANSAGIASAYGAPRTIEGYVRVKF